MIGVQVILIMSKVLQGGVVTKQKGLLPYLVSKQLISAWSTQIILYPYWDNRRDIRSNIPLRLKEFPRAKPKETSEGRRVYLTVYPESSPNKTLYHFNNHLAIVYLVILIDNLYVYSLGSVLCNTPLAPRKYCRVWFQYSIIKNDIM